MTDIIFSFDTENFTSDRAADAIRDEAEILRSEGVRGCFCLVGLLAKQLVSWGRTDVLAALSAHEIDLHTYGHTLHPMINEYTDIADFSAARDEVVRQESEALGLIEKATGVGRMYAAVPPGNQKSYAAMYAYADMGIPIYADTFCDTPDGRGVYCCNIYHIDYTFCMESRFFTAGPDELREIADSLACSRRAVVYTHPHIALFSEHWDVLNYDGTNQREFGDWIEAPRRPAEDSERFYRNIREFVRLIKADPRFRITTYGETAANLASRPKRKISRKDIPGLRERLRADFAPSEYSISDVFLACADMLSGADSHECGKTYGFLELPYAAEESFRLTAEDIRAAVRGRELSGFLPASLTAGGRTIGPADWLFAAMDILCGAGWAEITPRPQLPSLDWFPKMRDCAFRGTWRHSPEFEDRYLSDRLRLQSWTMKY